MIFVEQSHKCAIRAPDHTRDMLAGGGAGIAASGAHWLTNSRWQGAAQVV